MSLKMFKIIALILVFLFTIPAISQSRETKNLEYWEFKKHFTLKTPYVIYKNDKTRMRLVVQTSRNVKKVEVRWSSGSPYDWTNWHELTRHKMSVTDNKYDYRVYIHDWGDDWRYDTTVHYQVRMDAGLIYGKREIKDMWFKTPYAPSHPELTFYAISDTYPGYGDYVEVMNALYADVKENVYERARLLLHCGNIVWQGGKSFKHPEDGWWNKGFFGLNWNCYEGKSRHYANYIINRLHIMTSLGEKDYLSLDGDDNFKYYYTNFPYPMYEEKSKKDCKINPLSGYMFGGGEKNDFEDRNCGFYSFDYGPAHFISLSRPVYSENSGIADECSNQYKWLEEDLKKNKKKWVIVFFNYPIRIEGWFYKGTSHVGDLLRKYGVDAVLQGEHHYYWYSRPTAKQTP